MQLVLEGIAHEIQQGRPVADERLNRDSAAIFGIIRQLSSEVETEAENHELMVIAALEIKAHLDALNQLEHVRLRDVETFMLERLIETDCDEIYEQRFAIIEQVLNTWEARTRGNA